MHIVSNILNFCINLMSQIFDMYSNQYHMYALSLGNVHEYDPRDRLFSRALISVYNRF